MNWRKKPSTAPNPSLPDDLLISCFARVSRLHYPTFSLASKRFRSLLASPELYEVRSSLGHTESCLYVCLQFHPDPNTRWFTLCLKPNQTSTKKKKKKKEPTGYALAPTPVPNFPQAHWASVVSVGSNIYNIGSSIYKSPSSSVSILDCRTHTWREGPSMRVGRYWPAANVFDGKIYVAGGCVDINASNWMEVFDPKNQTWEPVLCPLAAESLIFKSVVIEDEICMVWYKGGVAYKPKEDKWEAIGLGMMHYFNLGWKSLSYSVIDNVLYCYNLGIQWYDCKKRHWMYLKGLELPMPMFGSYGLVKLVDYGGKMAVLWDNFVPSSGDKKIWCAVIGLERRNSTQIWGKVEWFDVVLTVPVCCEFVCAVAATV